MQKKITFFALSHTGSCSKRFAVSTRQMIFFVMAASVLLVVSGYMFWDYWHLKKISIQSCALKDAVASQREEILNQREQIQRFANDINSLKSRLIELSGLEKKVRVLSKMKQSEKPDGTFGMGGPAPEDLDTSIALSDKHNQLVREMHEQIKVLDQTSRAQYDEFEDLLKYLEDQQALLASTPSILPVPGRITSTFGYRKSPFNDLREFHKGLDISAPSGSPMVAPADGIVTFSGSKGCWGNLIVIDHGHGLVTQYAHAKKLLKKRGETVKRGDVIARVGSTGRSTGPHVHYEVHLNGIPVNPKKYVLN